MMTLSAKRDEVAYAPAVDMLYIVQNGGSLDACDEIEDVWPQGITVMTTDESISGIEIYDFKERYGEPPLTIDVQASEPFRLEIPFALA